MIKSAAAALLLCSSGAVVAQSDAAATAAKFGALTNVSRASLSPDGGKVAFISQQPVGSIVYAADVVTGGAPKVVMAIPKAKGEVADCSWVTTARIACRGYFIFQDGIVLNGATRIYAADMDSKNFVELSPPLSMYARGTYYHGGSIIDYDVNGEMGKVLMTRQYLRTDDVQTKIGSTKEGLGVEVVDTVTLKRSTIEKPRGDAVDYITDGHGNVRIMGLRGSTVDGYARGGISYSYRKQGERDWNTLGKFDDEGETGFNPYAVDAKTNVVYGFDDDGDYRSLYSIALDGSGAKTKVLGKDGFDVDALITIGRHNRVVGASYATDRREIEYFDAELKRLSQALHKALPGSPSVYIVDASADESKLLLLATSDTLPGQYYVYDKAKRELNEVLPARPELSATKLATMQAVTYKAADGTAIPAYLTLPPGSSGKNLPAIVMPHGGPSSRDEWGFDWLSQYFAARGFAVLQPNYRGSSGYGSKFFQDNGFQGWRTAIGDVNDAGRWLEQQGIAAKDKLAIVGWSYGGYAALQSAVLNPSLYKAVVAIAPVADLAKLKSDAAEFTSGQIVARFVGDGPHIREGSPAQNADRIVAPVLMFSGDKDLNVDVGQPRLMEKRLKDAGKQVTYVEFPGLDHQIVDAKARTRMLSESDAFIRKALALPSD